LAREGDGGEQERDDRGEEQRADEQDAAALAVPAAQPAVPRQEHALEFEVDARRLSPLRPSPVPVTTVIACHSSDIVLHTPVRETDSRRSVCASKAWASSRP
jgi:hypothetical protein